jgi:hypothetical protein
VCGQRQCRLVVVAGEHGIAQGHLNGSCQPHDARGAEPLAVKPCRRRSRDLPLTYLGGLICNAEY